MGNNVQELLAEAKKDYDRGVRMSREDQEKQAESFAYGNTNIENDQITRELVSHQAEKLKENEGPGNSKPH